MRFALCRVDVSEESEHALQQTRGTVFGLGAIELVALTSVVLLPLAGSLPVFIFSAYTPRMAVLLSAGSIGLVSLVWLAATRDRAAISGLALVGWTTFAAFLTGAPLLSLKGTFGRDLSGLMVVSAVGLWALGRSAPDRAGLRAEKLLLGSLTVCAAVGVIQVVFNIQTGALALQYNRAVGLTPSPIYFGALMAGGATLAASSTSLTWRHKCLAVGSFALAVDLSGSRVAVAGGLLVIGVSAARTAIRDQRWLPMLVLGAYLSGLLLSILTSATVLNSRTSFDRFTAGTGADRGLGTAVASRGGGGSDGRLDVWRYGLEAILERPFTGWGFGRFRAATQGRWSAEFAQSAIRNRNVEAWFDAHNIVVTVASAAGVFGVLLAAWFAVEIARGSRGPLAVFGLTVSLTWMLQPMSLATLPLVMLAFGLATTSGGSPMAGLPINRLRQLRTTRVAGAAVGIALAGWLLIGDAAFHAAVNATDGAAAARAASALPRDAVVDNIVAQVFFVEEATDPSLRDEVRMWSERALDHEPDRPYFYNEYAKRLITWGDDDPALGVLETSVDLQEWNLETWLLLGFMGERLGDDELVINSRNHICMMRSTPCEDSP